jgi:hypothetical protein
LTNAVLTQVIFTVVNAVSLACLIWFKIDLVKTRLVATTIAVQSVSLAVQFVGLALQIAEIVATVSEWRELKKAGLGPIRA